MTKLRMSDNSMSPKIEKDDIIMIDDVDRETVDGKIYLVTVDNKAMIRKVTKREDGYFLEPLNPSLCFPSIVPFNSDIRILGRVTEIRREV